MSRRDFRPLPPGEASYPTTEEFAPQRRSVLRQLGAGLGLLLLGGNALAGEPSKKKPPKQDGKKKPKPPEHVHGGKSGPSSELDEDLAEDLAAGDDKGKKKPKGKGKGKGKKGDDAPKKPHPPLRGEPSHPEAALDGEGRGPWEVEAAGDSKDRKTKK